jgi:pilus assembly protein Flp/PilA
MYTLVMWLKNWFEREEGQDLVEYALLIVFIAIVVIAGATLLGTDINAVYSNIASRLNAGL